MNLSEEDKWIFAVTYSEATSSVFNINTENNTSSTTTRSYWNTRGGPQTTIKPKEKLDLREEIDIELHVAEVEKLKDIRWKMETMNINYMNLILVKTR